MVLTAQIQTMEQTKVKPSSLGQFSSDPSYMMVKERVMFLVYQVYILWVTLLQKKMIGEP